MTRARALLFLAGAAVTLIVTAALTLLVRAAILDGREDARQRALGRDAEERAAHIPSNVHLIGERVPRAA